MQDSIISTSVRLLPSHVHADDSSPYQNYDTTIKFHDGKKLFQQYLFACRASVLTRQRNSILEYLKKVVGGLENSNTLGLIPPPAY